MASGTYRPKHKRHGTPASGMPGEARCRPIAASVAGDAIFMLDAAGRIAGWNAGAERMNGYAGDEVIGRHLSIFSTPEDIEIGKPVRELDIARRDGRAEDQGWRVRRDGSHFWANVTITMMHDEAGAPIGFVATTRDLSESAWLAADTPESGLSGLPAQIEDAREQEQRRIARELHDDLGQQLTAFRMSVALLEDDLAVHTGAPSLLALAHDLAAQIDTMAASVRRIVSDLRPPVLDDLGLVAALGWLAEEFTRRHGVQADTRFAVGAARFTDYAATAIFRMVQEALTNVARHAQASRVEISVARRGGAYVVNIADNGVGAAPDSPRRHHALGLLGMSERAQHLGGSVSIDSAPGNGFRIEIRLPTGAIESRHARAEIPDQPGCA